MSRKLKTGLTENKNKLKLFCKNTPAEIAGPITHICGNKEVSVDGCLGVIDYYENLIKLRIAGGEILFSGTGLRIVELTDSSALIKGTVHSVEFSVR